MASLLLDWSYHKLINPLKNIFTTHQRLLLFICIIVLEIFSILLVGYALFLAYLFYNPNPTSYTTVSNSDTSAGSTFLDWIGLSIVGIFMMITCVIGLRGAHTVNLSLLLTFFWAVMIFIGPLLIAVVVGFDFYLFLYTYFYHGWEGK